MKVGDEVKYTGGHRRYLRNRLGMVVASSTVGSSVLVDFPREGVWSECKEWIGINSLEIVKPASMKEVLTTIEDRISALEVELEKLRQVRTTLKELA